MTNRPRPQIIDMHAHVAGVGAGESGCYVSPRLKRNWRYRIYLRAFGVSREELEREGDALLFARLSARLAESKEVAGAVILALDGAVDDRGELDLDRTEVYIPNDFVARETARYGNLYFGASINPYRKDALLKLDEAAAQGAVLLKWLPSIQGIDTADPRLVPFYLRLKEHGLPLLVHVGNERSFSGADDGLGDPARLHLPLSLGVTVIAAHAATTGRTDGEENVDRLLKMFPQYPNLYADISSLTQLNKMRYLPKVLERPEIRERLLYGTDMPLTETALVSPWYFPGKLPLRTIRGLARIDNPWDKDVRLKRALGVPDEIFARSARLLKLEGKGAH